MKNNYKYIILHTCQIIYSKWNLNGTFKKCVLSYECDKQSELILKAIKVTFETRYIKSC